MKSLELRIFRFDKNHDYESYYKPYVYGNYEDFATLYALLLRVQEDDIYFEFEKNSSAFIRLNRQLVPLSSPVKQLVRDVGLEWVIEPLSTKRAFKDLLFDKGDFWEKFAPLSQWADAADKRLYAQCERFYYGSEILPHHPDFMGDAAIYLAHKLIQKNPAAKDAILNLLADKERGIFYHLPTQNAELEEAVDILQAEILKQGLFDEALLRPKNPVALRLDFSTIKHDFKGFNIACYGFKPCDFSHLFKANFITLESAHNGSTLLNLNADLAYKMASTILLDAYDSGADFMLVGDGEDFFIFDSCAKELMRSSGRDFWDFYILKLDEFKLLAEGVRPSTLQNHTLKVSLM